MRIDPSKDALQNVIDLINAANSTVFVKNGPVQFSGVSDFTGPNGHDAKITLSGDRTQGYTGSVDVYYSRIGLDQNTTTPPLAYKVDATTTPAQLLAQAVSKLNLIPSEVQAISSIPKNAASVPLNPVANSLVYKGSINLKLLWPAPSPYVFLYDQFNGSGGLGSHTGDSGVQWVDSDPFHPDPGSALVGGFLTTTNPTNTGGVSTTILPSEYVVELAVSIDQIVGAGVNTKLTIAGGAYYASYNLDVTLNSDGSMVFDSLRDGAHQTANSTWVSGAHILKLLVEYGKTTVYWDNVQMLQVTSSLIIDSAPVKFKIDNGTMANAVRLDWIKARTNLAMDILPFSTWMISQAAQSWANGIAAGPDNKIWVTMYDPNQIKQYLRAFDRNTGALLTNIDISALTGFTSQYTVRFVTSNNIVWCENLNPPEGNPSVQRFDGNTGLWKDSIVVGQYSSLQNLSLLAPDHVWGVFSGSSGTQLQKFDADTGNRIATVAIGSDPVYGNSATSSVVFDPTSNRVFVTRRNASTLATFLVGYDVSTGQQVASQPIVDYLYRSGCSVGVGGVVLVALNSTSDGLVSYDANLNPIHSAKFSDSNTELSTDPNINISIQFGGPFKYIAQRDEIWFQAFRQKTDDPDHYRTEIWAVRRSDLGGARQVIDYSVASGRIAYASGDVPVFDCDQGGNAYSIHTNDNSNPNVPYIARDYHG